MGLGARRWPESLKSRLRQRACVGLKWPDQGGRYRPLGDVQPPPAPRGGSAICGTAWGGLRERLYTAEVPMKDDHADPEFKGWTPFAECTVR